jgi:excisionase family DNA binding protein
MATQLESATTAKRSQLLKVSDVAQLLNVKPRTIYEMVAQDRIPLSQAARLKHSAL